MCCGKKRTKARQKAQAHQVVKPTEKTTSPHESERHAPAYFQYIGERGLRVVGPKTRKLYRFDGPGAVVAVDPRDQRALSAVSILRQVEKGNNVANKTIAGR